MSDPVARLNTALEGRYAIERELGEGGMATVYLAEDLKHHRKVALKVLKPELAAVVGAERFLAEIKVTANLQHPHILPLFDSGEADSFLFYVMPYVEGDTLKDRLDREKQLPVDEAVKIAMDVAEALQAAHEQGVIHRDIKPGNILISRGKPLISDFGIALALRAAGAGERLTETGLSLGTPHYMSPEQATGDQAVGSATDTYALGSVLYEMLVGEPPYPGTTAQAVLGKIIAGKPVSAMEERPSIPANVDAAVRKALEKLPADRFTSAQDFAKALGDEHYRYGEEAAAAAGATAGPWNRLTVVGWSFATVTTLALAWSLFGPEPADPPRPVTRVSVHIPEDEFFHPSRGDFDLSSDGSVMVYRGVGDEGQPLLWVRRWDALDARPIRDTDGALRPKISPDGREVVFNVNGSIRVVPIQGGVSRTLTSTGTDTPGWSPDGAWIYFNNPAGGLSRTPSAGGAIEIITEVDTAAGDANHYMVDVLPGSGAVYQVVGPGNVTRIQAVDFETGEVKDLTLGRYPIYSTTGHLLFQDATEAMLLAAPFDVETMEFTGPALPLADGLMLVGLGNVGNVAISQTGKLIYRTGSSAGLVVTPVWVERDGTAREIDPGWTALGGSLLSSVVVSPNGDRLAISIEHGQGADLWVKQLETGPLSRLTFEGIDNYRPNWSRDGQALTFISNRAGQLDVWTKRADGSGSAGVVLDRGSAIQEGFYSPDGTWLVYREGGGIFAIRPGVDSVAVPLVATEFGAHSPALSPDGRWLAYVSNDTGRNEVYMRPFPDTGSGLVQVSTDGGVEPLWAHSSRELFYRNGANELVAVQVSAGPSFGWDRQDVLFSTADYLPGASHPQYDVTPDDQRFVMLRVEEPAGTELILVENWLEELKRLVPN